MKYYRLNFLGIERKLPILKTPSGISIAAFNPVGDMEILTKSGKKLAKFVKKHKIFYDIILTTELKGLPIAQEVGRNLKCDYIALRKEKKCYIPNPIQVSGESITSGKSSFYISELDMDRLKDKKVLFVDDVYSTGSTFEHMLTFSKNANFKIVCGLYMLREGDGQAKELKFYYQDIPFFACGFLPLPDEK